VVSVLILISALILILAMVVEIVDQMEGVEETVVLEKPNFPMGKLIIARIYTPSERKLIINRDK